MNIIIKIFFYTIILIALVTAFWVLVVQVTEINNGSRENTITDVYRDWDEKQDCRISKGIFKSNGDGEVWCEHYNGSITYYK